jgi:hypothetical protein
MGRMRNFVLVAAFLALLASSAASAKQAAVLAITDTHYTVSQTTPFVDFKVASTEPITDVSLFCEVSWKDSRNAYPYATGIASLDGAGTIAFVGGGFVKGRTLAECDLSYLDAAGVAQQTGLYDIWIVAGGE